MKTVPFGGTFSLSTLLYISFGTKARLPRDVFGWDNCTRENRNVRQAVQTPEGERHGRSLSRCRRDRLKRPSRDGGGDRVYVRATSRAVGSHAKCHQPQFRPQQRDPCGNRRLASGSALKRTARATTARPTFTRLPEGLGR